MSLSLAGLPLVSLVVFLPLAGAIAVAFTRADRPNQARYTALAFALAAWVVSIVMLAGFVSADGFQFRESVAWIPAFGINYTVAVDGLSLVLVVLTTTLSLVSILYSFGPITNRVKEYMASFLVLQVGMTGAFVAQDLFLFYIFWEIVLVPMYLIIGIWGGKNRIYATIKFVLYTLVGSLLMLVAILATAFSMASATGTWDHAFDLGKLIAYASQTGAFGGAFGILAFAAFALAFAIKVPMFPFHTWLPDAHTEAPTAGSVILAGLLLKLGGYGFIRFAVPLFTDAAHWWAPLIIALSVIAILYGAVVALVQPDLKRLVAYSSVSHMGFVTLGIFVFNQQALQGAILQMVNHGLITGALFLLVGVIYERTHDRTLAKMGGLGGPMPVYAAALGFFVFASVGLPGLSGFVSEFMTLLGTFTVMPWVAAAATVVMIFAAGYLLWMLQRMTFGEPSEFLQGIREHLVDMRPIEALSLVPLGALVVVFGIFPGLILTVISWSVEQAVPTVAQTGPTILGLLR